MGEHWLEAEIRPSLWIILEHTPEWSLEGLKASKPSSYDQGGMEINNARSAEDMCFKNGFRVAGEIDNSPPFVLLRNYHEFEAVSGFVLGLNLLFH